MMFKNKTFIVGAIAGAGVACAALAGAGLQWPGAAAQSQSSLLIPASGQVNVVPPPGAPITFADIVDRVSPAVVSIETRAKVNAEALRRIPGFENFPFAIPQQPNGKGAQGQNGQGGQGGQDDQDTPEQFGAGSGFFISPDGYIVTNNHVVEGADEIKVKFPDNHELPAKVVGRDPSTDLAVIKVEGHNFPYVDFETSAKPRVGDWVIAIGNPFTLGGTVTAGIVSAYSRDIGEQYVDYMQIDAPINRGNSGGPTFDIYGRVIGVNTAIYSPNGAYAGIGFAIPADLANSITKELIAHGKIDRGYLGVTISAITDEIAASLNLPDKAGAYVTEVTPGGPSDKAGVRVGDIITSLDGKKVKDNTELTRRVAQARAGQDLHLDVVRSGRPMAITVRSGVRPSDEQLAAQGPGAGAPAPAAPPAVQGTAVLGLDVAPLDAAARRQFAVPAGVNGVVITGVERGSPASKRPFRPGDVIVMADNRPVSSVAEFQAAVAGVKSSGRPSVLLLIEREGRNYPTVVPFEGK